MDGLADRFGSEHHGLGKLSGDYRADKKTVAAFTKEGIDRDDAQEHLALAVAWKRAVAAVAAAEARTRRSSAPTMTAGPRTGARSARRSNWRTPQCGRPAGRT